MNHATTPQATKKETTKPISRMIHCSPLMCPGEKASPGSLCEGSTAFFRANRVAANIVGMETKNENSSAADRDMPATCPAAMVDIERLVPGKTAERIWHAPIQIACGMVVSSMVS